MISQALIDVLRILLDETRGNVVPDNEHPLTFANIF